MNEASPGGEQFNNHATAENESRTSEYGSGMGLDIFATERPARQQRKWRRRNPADGCKRCNQLTHLTARSHLCHMNKKKWRGMGLRKMVKYGMQLKAS